MEWGWSVDDVMPRRDGPENSRILKKSQLEVEIGPWRQTVGDSAIESKSWVFRTSTGRDELRSWTPRDVPNICGGGSIIWLRKTFKNCVSLLVSMNCCKKLTNAFVPETRVRLYCICIWLYMNMYMYCCDWYHYDYHGYTTRTYLCKSLFTFLRV